MNAKDWILLIVPTGISILGFVITFFKMRQELKDALKKSNYEDKKRVYTQTLALFERFIKVDFYNVENEVEFYNDFDYNESEILLLGTDEIYTLYQKLHRVAADICILNAEHISSTYKKKNLPSKDKLFEEYGKFYRALIIAMKRDLEI